MPIRNQAARIRRAFVLSNVLMFVSVGCHDSTEPVDEQPEQAFVVRGSIQNNSGEAIPAEARVVISWTVAAGSPDYSFVFGEGSLDLSDGTFEVILDAPPPAAALNNGALGVGVPAVVTNTGVSTGDDLADLPPEQIIGAAGEYAVIYVAEPAAAQEVRDWSSDFSEGYGAGTAGPEENGFETFLPTDPNAVPITIDDLDNIRFVNWT